MKIRKSEFLAEFFCTEAAAEIVKAYLQNMELTPQGKIADKRYATQAALMDFASYLWDQIDQVQELEDHEDPVLGDDDDDDDDQRWKNGF